jgi:hypothetical protein
MRKMKQPFRCHFQTAMGLGFFDRTLDLEQVERQEEGMSRLNIPSSRRTGSPGRIRTCDLVVNSHPLCRLSYRGIDSQNQKMTRHILHNKSSDNKCF